MVSHYFSLQTTWETDFFSPHVFLLWSTLTFTREGTMAALSFLYKPTAAYSTHPRAGIQ